MNRRNIIKTLAMAPIVAGLSNRVDAKTMERHTLKPKMLMPGDTIALIAPGTAVSDPDDIAKIKDTANYFNLKVKFQKYSIKGSGYKSRSIEERLDDLHSAFSDSGVKGVFCLRGGYGSAQLLDKINYDLIAKNPKIFVGYSDITALHLAINRYSGLVTFHGPVMLSSFSQFTINYYKKALFSQEPIGQLINPDSKNTFRAVYPIRTIVPGRAKGKITGGNLTIISTTLGTPYEIDTKGKILFIEDVGEEPYRIDRMLTQLRLAGKLKEASGIVVGRCNDCGPKEFNPSTVWDYSLGEVLDNILGNLDIPVIYGLLFGHTSDQITLPFGVDVEMDSEKGLISIPESGVTA